VLKELLVRVLSDGYQQNKIMGAEKILVVLMKQKPIYYSYVRVAQKQTSQTKQKSIQNFPLWETK